MSKLKYPLKEYARRADAIFDRRIEPLLTSKDKGKFVAIDVESGDFALASTRLLAFKRLRARLPDCLPFFMRVGYPAAVKFGHHVRSTP